MQHFVHITIFFSHKIDFVEPLVQDYLKVHRERVLEEREKDCDGKTNE